MCTKNLNFWLNRLKFLNQFQPNGPWTWRTEDLDLADRGLVLSGKYIPKLFLIKFKVEFYKVLSHFITF